MTPLQSNKPVFFDGDTPLNGTIYVGQPGTDPRTNKKTVTFEDSGGAQFEAKQPLQVLDGKVVYNGKPIIALVDGAYSAILFDGAGRQVDYIKSFNPSGGSTSGVNFSEVTRVGLTLDDVKAFDVAVGETVRSVGKTLATDNLGADWLAVSPTGETANDKELIDFNNGLQGMRVNNSAYSARVNKIGSMIFDQPQKMIAIESIASLPAYREKWVNVSLASAVPSEASSAIIRVLCNCSYPNASTDKRIGVDIYCRKAGSSGATLDNELRVLSDRNAAASNADVSVSAASEFRMPLSPGQPPSFDIYLLIQDPLVGSGNINNITFYVSVVGYEIRYTDAEI